MNLSQRERYVFLAVVVTMAIFVLDRYAINPYINYRDKMGDEKRNLIGKIDDSGKLFARRKQMGQRWKDMVAGGLKGTASETESEVLNAVRNWSQESGVNLTSLKPEPVAGKGETQEIVVLAAGTGTMGAVTQFMQQVEGTKLPLKIIELQLGSRKEGADDLSMQMRLSALCIVPQTASAKQPPAKKATGGTKG